MPTGVTQLHLSLSLSCSQNIPGNRCRCRRVVVCIVDICYYCGETFLRRIDRELSHEEICCIEDMNIGTGGEFYCEVKLQIFSYLMRLEMQDTCLSFSFSFLISRI